jgi:hypothetical protein
VLLWRLLKRKLVGIVPKRIGVGENEQKKIVDAVNEMKNSPVHVGAEKKRAVPVLPAAPAPLIGVEVLVEVPTLADSVVVIPAVVEHQETGDSAGQVQSH